MTDEQNIPVPTSDATTSPASTSDVAQNTSGDDGAAGSDGTDWQAENQELKDKLLRTQAEWVNYRNRTEREKNELGDFIKSKVWLDVLPIYENLQRALAATRAAANDGLAAMQEGVSNILEQFEKVLSLYGITRIATVGQTFDYKLHEALLMGEGPKDLILEELDPGYLMGERVLRVAKVKVGNGGGTLSNDLSAESPENSVPNEL